VDVMRDGAQAPNSKEVRLSIPSSTVSGSSPALTTKIIEQIFFYVDYFVYIYISLRNRNGKSKFSLLRSNNHRNQAY
jgi:hypothetical protein